MTDKETQTQGQDSRLSFEGGHLEPLRGRMSASSDAASAPLPMFIPKIISRPVRQGFGLKIGIFGGLHGDEEAGTLACEELVRWAGSHPPELQDYELHIFPVCNPSGREAGTRHCWEGFDLNRLFWKDSDKPEIIYLEKELRLGSYDGIVALHSDDTSDGCYGFVSGALLSEHLLKPALAATDPILPRNRGPVIDGFPAEDGIIKEGYTGILSAPPEQQPRPLEIVFETPALAPMDLQVQASVVAVQTILAEFRLLQSFAMNL